MFLTTSATSLIHHLHFYMNILTTNNIYIQSPQSYGTWWFSLSPLPFQPNLPQTIFIWMGFTYFVKMKEHTLGCKGGYQQYIGNTPLVARWAKFNQHLYKQSLGKWNSSLKSFFSRTDLGYCQVMWAHPWVKEIQIYLNEGPTPFLMGINCMGNEKK